MGVLELRPIHDFDDPHSMGPVLVDLAATDNGIVKIQPTIHQVVVQDIQGRRATARVIRIPDMQKENATPKPVADEEHGEIFTNVIGCVNLAKSVLADCKKSLSLSNLETAIFLFRQALQDCPKDHPHYHEVMCKLASALGVRFMHTAAEPHANELQLLAEELLPSTEKSGVTVLPASGNRNSFQREIVEAGKFAADILADFHSDIHMSISHTMIFLLRHCLPDLPATDPMHHEGFLMLAQWLYIRYWQTGAVVDLNDAVLLLSSNAQSQGRGKLQSAHQQILAVSAARLDNEELLVHFRSVMPYLSGSHGNILPLDSYDACNYASGLLLSFQRGGNIDLLEEGIRILRNVAPNLPSSHSCHVSFLSNLATALSERYKRSDHAADLEEAIAIAKRALELSHLQGLARPGIIHNLATFLGMRFQKNSQPQDLDEAISLHYQAVNLASRLSEPEKTSLVSSLASALKERYISRHDVKDLNTSISFHHMALQTNLSGRERSRVLSNLANTLTIRFHRQRNPCDLDEALSMQKQALGLLSPQDPIRFDVLAVLGGILQHKLELRLPSEAQDLDKTIAIYKKALALVPVSSRPNYHSVLKNLIWALSRRCKRLRTSRDVEDSITLQTCFVNFLASNHPQRPDALIELAKVHMLALEILTESAVTQPNLEQGMLCFSQAVQTQCQKPLDKFHRAKLWAQYAEHHGHPSTLEAYDIALETLARVAALHGDVQSRQVALRFEGTDGISRRAARFAIRERDLKRAVEYLEMGRGIFWSAALYSHPPSVQLRAALPNRKPKNFECLLQTTTFQALKAAARDSPIVYLIANMHHSDCIILTATGLHHVPMPGLPAFKLFELVKALEVAALGGETPKFIQSGIMENVSTYQEQFTGRHNLGSELPEVMTFNINEKIGVIPSFVHAVASGQYHVSGQASKATIGGSPIEAQKARGDTSSRAARPAVNNRKSSDDVFKDVLSTLWEQAVKPIVDFFGLKKSSERTTIRWCTTGLFAFLPMHAAGCYDEGKMDYASEYFISSYTPTAATLLMDNAQAEPANGPAKMMTVIQSQDLPNTRKELENIEKHISATSTQIVKFGVPGAPATVDAVATQLSDASIVHFACHGRQDEKNPLDSGLEVGGELLSISRIMQEKVSHGALAFLSACETAVGDERVPDEGMSVASSLLFAGFRSVVATMWKMEDSDGPVIADAFYEELCRGPDGNPLFQPDTSRSAKALSIAVEKLRLKGVPFKRWVPFIHMGK